MRNMKDIQRQGQSLENITKLIQESITRNPYAQKEGVALEYFGEIINEVNEAKEEYKKDNVVYFEDELGDIFWDYMTLLHILQRDGYIRSIEHVLDHAHDKFAERAVSFQTQDVDEHKRLWKEIKEKQKAELKERHREMYGHTP